MEKVGIDLNSIGFGDLLVFSMKLLLAQCIIGFCLGLIIFIVGAMIGLAGIALV